MGPHGPNSISLWWTPEFFSQHYASKELSCVLPGDKSIRLQQIPNGQVTNTLEIPSAWSLRPSQICALEQFAFGHHIPHSVSIFYGQLMDSQSYYMQNAKYGSMEQEDTHTH